MGSVKDLEIVRMPTKKEMGSGIFRFSDRYSVFDFGEMPDKIPNKGKALCMIGAYFFERFEEEGIKTHYKGVLDEDGRLCRTDELESPTESMEISLVRVIRPDYIGGSYDYSKLTEEFGNFLIPLEFIYRNKLPPGSSVFKRLEKGEIKPEDLGLDHYPTPGEELDTPILEVSTKLEEKDRYISWDEARSFSGLLREEVEEIKTLLLRIDDKITEIVEKAGLVNEDGKIELALDPRRELMVVDVAGTPDECRLTKDDVPVSKEVVREFYRGTRWYEEVERAKELAHEKGIKDWRTLCKYTPPRLDEELKRIVSDMYTSTANEILGKKIFDAPRLDQVIKEYKCWIEDRKK